MRRYNRKVRRAGLSVTSAAKFGGFRTPDRCLPLECVVLPSHTRVET